MSKITTPKPDENLIKFITDLKKSLNGNGLKQIIESKSTKLRDTKDLTKICKYIERQSAKLTHTFSSVKKFRAPREDTQTYSIEIHKKPEGYVLYVLIKTKGGSLDARGSFKRVKDCLKFQNNKWSVEVNGTLQSDQKHQDVHSALESIQKEYKIASSVGEKYVVPIEIGVEYKGKGYSNKISVFSEKGVSDLFLFQDNLPQEFNFENLFSICLTSAMSLSAFHAKGWVHRDIKLENIMLYHDNGLYYAKLFDVEATEESGKLCAFFGTPACTSPELIYEHGWNKPNKYIRPGDNIYKIIEMIDSKKITGIKPTAVIDFKDDVWSLADTLDGVCSAFLDKNNPSQENKAIESLRKYLWEKILIKPREQRASSQDLLKILQDWIPNLKKSGLISSSFEGKIQKKYSQDKIDSKKIETVTIKTTPPPNHMKITAPKPYLNKPQSISKVLGVKTETPRMVTIPLRKSNPVASTSIPEKDRHFNAINKLIKANPDKPIKKINDYLLENKFMIPKTFIKGSKHVTMSLCLHRLLTKRNSLEKELKSLHTRTFSNLFLALAGEVEKKRDKIKGIDDLIKTLISKMEKEIINVPEIISEVVARNPNMTAGFFRNETETELFDMLKFYDTNHLHLSKQSFFNIYRPEIGDKDVLLNDPKLSR